MLPQLPDNERAAKASRLHELQRQLALAAPLIAEEKALRDEMQPWFESQPADKPVTSQFGEYTIIAGARENERSIIDQKKAFNLLRKAVGSLDGAIALVTITLTGAIDKYIPKAQHKLILKQERSGSRPIKCVRNVA